jgi:ferredoxin-type protein NapF
MTSPNLQRRSLFKGRLGTSKSVFRPPWETQTADFTDLCTRCGDCVQECPEGILVKGDGGFPEIDFKLGECTFCGDCASACETQALLRTSEEQSPWTYVAEVKESCLAHQGVVCRTCSECCEARAITFKPEIGGVSKPLLDADVCNGCGACISGCPVGAIDMKIGS